MPIEHISDTARWVAVYRAMETERPDALFKDPFARQLAGSRGEEIVATMKRGRSMAWAMVVRTVVIDELIVEAVEKRGVRRVVNLAAGLDARPWRMNLPSSLKWVDVDLPGILDYKLGVIGDAPPRFGYTAERTDLTSDVERESLFERLRVDDVPTLVVTEGLLIYLTSEQVGSLARALHGIPGADWWVIDIASPKLLEIMTRMWGREAKAGNAPFQFAPAEGTAFFEPFGWREAEYRSALDEAHRIRREMQLMWLWRLLAGFSAKRRAMMKRMSGFALLERV
jgi:methyltransferase (TIGR00027 family)